MKWTATFKDGRLELEGADYEESGAIIKVDDEGISHLYEIPQYGGEPSFHAAFSNINDAIKETESWT